MNYKHINYWWRNCNLYCFL